MIGASLIVGLSHSRRTHSHVRYFPTNSSFVIGSCFVKNPKNTCGFDKNLCFVIGWLWKCWKCDNGAWLGACNEPRRLARAALKAKSTRRITPGRPGKFRPAYGEPAKLFNAC